MNIFNVREDHTSISKIALGEIKNGFERALIWQDEYLNDFDGLPLMYAARYKVDQLINTFVSFVCSIDGAKDEMIKNGYSQTGHTIALQMLGHGVGFWDDDETKTLDQCLDFLIGSGAIKPFKFYHLESENKLDWDIV